MIPFDALFPDVAPKESRSMSTLEDGPVPKDHYLFREFYCVERGCDCRRVILSVIGVEAKGEVAVINHALDRQALGFEEGEETILEPFGRQSRHADALLDLFRSVVLQPDYAARLMRHYQMVREAVQDPTHPAQAVIAKAGDPQASPRPTTARPTRVRWAPSPENPAPPPTAPCPCGSGRRYRKCCLRR
jgi:hypothetical protein